MLSRLKHWMRVSCMLGICSVVSPCFAGYYTGNAGDAYSAEFILAGRDLVQKLRFASSDVVDLPDPNYLAGVIGSVLVHSEERVYNNGQEVDAANLYPKSNQIILNRARWSQLRQQSQTRQRLLVVLHEYLWMMGIEDLGFKKSAPIIDLLAIGNMSPNIYWNPINPVNIVELKPQVMSGDCTLPPIEFDPGVDTESKPSIPTGSCTPENFRRVVIRKDSSLIPPSKGLRGKFQRYYIEIYDQANQLLEGDLMFEPDWGRCLQMDETACRFSGIIRSSGVEFSFGFIRKD